MTIDRRKFMCVGGLTALALAVTGKRALPEEVTKAIEVTAPKPPLVAKRWAMVIDVRKCLAQGECTDCIKACHLAHNVPDFGNPKDEIKWIWREPFEHVFPELEHPGLDEAVRKATIPVMCNHCENPPCVRVCPTQATCCSMDGDGIVTMDPHRCIGCRYCMAACPYGSRSFNWRDPRPFIANVDPDYPTRTRGVVEKCTFCEERLDRGQLPACVEACKAKAMIFGDLEDPGSEVRAVLKERLAIRRMPWLGTQPQVYYIV